MAVFVFISNMVLYLLLAGQAPISGHLSPTPQVATYEKKRPAPVTDTFYDCFCVCKTGVTEGVAI